jgi:hypothetical protein
VKSAEDYRFAISSCHPKPDGGEDSFHREPTESRSVLGSESDGDAQPQQIRTRGEAHDDSLHAFVDGEHRQLLPFNGVERDFCD